MDIAGLSMAMSQNNVMQSVNIALLAKSLNQTQEVSEAMTELIEKCPTPNLGQSIDISI